MNDDRMDDMLIEGARDYNAPGAVPREEIWARIQAVRTARGGASATRQSHPARRLWVWARVGVAAAAILAAGVVLGRRMERPAAPVHVAAQPVSSQPMDTAKPRPDTRVAAADADSAAKTDSLIRQLHEQTKSTGRRVQELAASRPRATDVPRSAPEQRGSGQRSSALAYHLVVLQHLAGSEAMITAFRSTARRGEIDAQLATWSRELLSTTRMLEASPAADDPMMKRLLEDLDLVITQIVQYVTRGTNSADELDLIEQSINKRGVITKLRSTLPARTPVAGTI
jgi:hypothetical protein